MTVGMSDKAPAIVHELLDRVWADLGGGGSGVLIRRAWTHGVGARYRAEYGNRRLLTPGKDEVWERWERDPPETAWRPAFTSDGAFAPREDG